MCYDRVDQTKEKALVVTQKNHINVKPPQVSKKSQIQRYPNPCESLLCQIFKIL